MRFPFLLVIFLTVPLLEIAAFVLVGSRIGVLATLGMVLVTAVVGSLLLRVQGFGLLRRIQAETDGGRVPGRELVHGAMILLAGFLLLLPGFVTDAIGFLLFVPAFRDWMWRALARRVLVKVDLSAMGGAGARHRRDSRTIDLDEDDFTRTTHDTGDAGQATDGKDPSPWRRIDDGR
ncbi:membrane protein FxsA [Aquibium carbonis]|uniref:Membrane protein FxsA n=1 Tax=Aquibium carbonis TaxID=2495581 RepID=A0A3S0AVJ5_9HYPH|nr:FxsA family protein [Aquibium carbonis]RST88131.1 membrane protein FxsA [Aquibium carbonis]